MKASRLVLALVLLSAGAATAFEGPKLTRDRAATPVSRSWADVRDSIARSIAKTAEGYFAYSHAFNDIGPIDTAGGLTDEELHTQFAMACVLASPIAVNGAALKPQLEKWLADKMLMNVNSDVVARQGHVVAERDGAFVILKFLWGMNGAFNAVAFYNPTDEARRISVTARELSLSGKVAWTDRFDPAQKGEFSHELAFDVPAHGARLVYMNGKPLMRCEYRSEDAFATPNRRVWRNVFVPKSADYLVTVGAGSSAAYRVRVNGIDQGAFHGAACLRVRLEAPENAIDVTGAGADDVSAIWIARTDSMLDAITTSYRLAQFGKDYAANVLFLQAMNLPVGEPEPSGPVEERALVWIHDVHWTWQFDWLHARCAEANGDKTRAVELIEKGCFMFRDRYGIEPEDPAFWAHYKQLTGKDREKKTPSADKKDSAAACPSQNCVEWQNEHDKELAAAVTNAELDRAIDSLNPSNPSNLLASVRGAYETDPLLATKVAAVTARTMEPGQAVRRRIWAEALLRAAEETDDAYRTLFFLEQLRWCGFADQVPRLEALGKTGRTGVASFVAMLVRELNARSSCVR